MTETQKKWAMLALDVFINIPCYVLLNTLMATKGFSHDVALPIDEKIPFIPYFSPFYACVYVFPVICFFIIWKNYDLIRGAFKAFLALGVVCLLSYWIYPVEFHLRTSLQPPYGFFEQLVRFFYWADNPPYNCFPSMHVAGAFLGARMIFLYRARWAPWFYGIAWMITLSTLFIRQHYIIDVAAGLVLFWTIKSVFLPKDLLDRDRILGILQGSAETENL